MEPPFLRVAMATFWKNPAEANSLTCFTITNTVQVIGPRARCVSCHGFADASFVVSDKTSVALDFSRSHFCFAASICLKFAMQASRAEVERAMVSLIARARSTQATGLNTRRFLVFVDIDNYTSEHKVSHRSMDSRSDYQACAG